LVIAKSEIPKKLYIINKYYDKQLKVY